MATGIVSQAMHLDRAGTVSSALLAAAIVAYVIFAAASAWRFAACRPEFLADAADPGRAFSFCTFAAASDVLAARLGAAGRFPFAGALLAAGSAGWLLACTIPLLLRRRRGPGSPLAKADGSWFLPVVATQSIAVAATVVLPAAPDAQVYAIACWATGVVLYLLTAALVMMSLVRYPRRPADITPPYWIFMGAIAISVLAGAQILRLAPGPLTAGVRPVLSGILIALWSVATALIPVLVAAGIWRHLLHRIPLRYELGLWSIVFPVGMYAVASRELGGTLPAPWLASWGTAGAWAALAAWLAVALASLGSVPHRKNRPPASLRCRQDRSQYDIIVGRYRCSTVVIRRSAMIKSSSRMPPKPIEGRNGSPLPPLPAHDGRGSPLPPIRIRESRGSPMPPIAVRYSQGSPMPPIPARHTDGSPMPPIAVRDTRGSPMPPLPW